MRSCPVLRDLRDWAGEWNAGGPRAQNALPELPVARIAGRDAAVRDQDCFGDLDRRAAGRLQIEIALALSQRLERRLDEAGIARDHDRVVGRPRREMLRAGAVGVDLVELAAGRDAPTAKRS